MSSAENFTRRAKCLSFGMLQIRRFLQPKIVDIFIFTWKDMLTDLSTH